MLAVCTIQTKRSKRHSTAFLTLSAIYLNGIASQFEFFLFKTKPNLAKVFF